MHSFFYLFDPPFSYVHTWIGWFMCLCRDSQWHSDRYRWSDSDGPHCVFGVWSGSGSDAHQHGDRALHSDHHRCGHLPGCVLLHPVTHSGLHLVRGRHLPHRYYCRQCSRGPVGYCHCETLIQTHFVIFICTTIQMFGVSTSFQQGCVKSLKSHSKGILSFTKYLFLKKIQFF